MAHDDDNSELVTLYDDEALQLMQGWWGGQGDPLYAIYSMGGQHEAWVFVDAISNLDSDIARVKPLGRGKYQLGNGTFSKKEIDELHTIRNALADALYEATGEMREAGGRIAPGMRNDEAPRSRFALAPRRLRAASTYEVVVGNLGVVLTTDDFEEAQRTYDEYVDLAHRRVGRASREPVTLLRDGEPIKEWEPGPWGGRRMEAPSRRSSELPDELRQVIGTLAYNRDFTTAELVDYTRFERPEIAQRARVLVETMTRLGLLRKTARGRYYPTPKGWAWIEGG